MADASMRLAIVRFFRTPKGLLLIVLAGLVAFGAPHEGVARVWPGLTGSVVVASVIDLLILQRREGKWLVPDGAILTALIVAMLLSPMQPWYVATITSAIAVISKYLIRMRSANVFNPAALAAVITFYPFDTAQSWWGALPDVGVIGLIALFASGLYISARVNKLPLVLAFLGTHFLLFTVTAYLGGALRVAEIFREPDVNAALFFAFFMVTDPPTSPAKQPDQLRYGVIVAATSYVTFEFVGAAYFLLAGLLVANVWEAWRREQRRKDTLARRVAAKGLRAMAH
ncbi:MAG: RnfABCDGE type electron transport complex subunit D [bacterium]